jgi:hypothetical protein
VDDNNDNRPFGLGKISLDINEDGNELNELKRKLEASEVGTTVFGHYFHIFIYYNFQLKNAILVAKLENQQLQAQIRMLKEENRDFEQKLKEAEMEKMKAKIENDFLQFYNIF